MASATVLALISVAAGATTGGQTSRTPLLRPLDIRSVTEDPWMRLAYGTELSALAGYHPQPDDLTRTEERAFRGIGAIVCTVAGTRRSSTAFLVGTFDIAVTVAHTFQRNGNWAGFGDCIYHSADRWGEIRERIPIAYYKAQWREKPSAFGQPTKDLAMVRLSRPSRFAYRTLSFSRFAGSTAPVMLIGFRADPDLEPLKHKRSGTLFEGAFGNRRLSGVPQLIHDIDARGLASGAPVLDRRDGVVIGIHARVSSEAGLPTASGSKRNRRNAMLVMSDWLERVLRAEIAQLPEVEGQVTLR
jgi:hypothetical protein